MDSKKLFEEINRRFVATARRNMIRLSIMIVVLFMPGGVIELTKRMRNSRKIRLPWSQKPLVESTPGKEGL